MDIARQYDMEPRKWYIYVIHLDNRGKGSVFYGKKQCHYTGISRDVGRRMGDYLYSRGGGFVNSYFRDGRKTPLYVETLFGTEEEAARRERKIKRTRDKSILFMQGSNELVRYIPTKYIILKNAEGGETPIAIR